MKGSNGAYSNEGKQIKSPRCILIFPKIWDIPMPFLEILHTIHQFRQKFQVNIILVAFKI